MLFSIQYPHPTLLLFSNNAEFIGCIGMNEFDKRTGTGSSKNLYAHKFDELRFDKGWQDQGVIPDGDHLNISGVTLVRLCLWHAIHKRQCKELYHSDVRHYLSGNFRNNAERYLEYVAPYMINKTPLADLPNGVLQKLTIIRERAINADFWRAATL